MAGWFFKWLAVRYGGAQTYRSLLPLFLGLIFGEVFMRLFWSAVAMIHGEIGSGYRF